MAVGNDDLARVLRELKDLMILDEGSPQAFRVRAYERGLDALAGLPGPATEMSEADLVAVKGIGKGIARTIREYIDTGTIPRLEELRAEFPPAFVELTRIPGLGPKTLKLLRAELGVENLDDLNAAIAAQRLRELPGLGAKTEEKVSKAIERLGMHGKDRRTPIAEALPIGRSIARRLAELANVEHVELCGSLRRFSETVGDLDVLVAASDPTGITGEFVGLDVAAQVIAHGDTKAAILTRQGLQVDLRVVPPESFGAAQLYFTGSKAHNIELRQRALARGWTLNEYALADAETEEVVAAATEDEIYAALDLAPIPPELREGAGEVDAAAAGALPELVARRDVVGDLHDHTDLSGDGRAPLEAMLAAAVAADLSYVAITDHGEDLTINGVDRAGMLRQRERLRAIQKEVPGLVILHGSELNIGVDGGLDYDHDFLMGFDWCVASVHSHFDLPAEEQTARLIQAIEHPAVNVIGHLSGRMIGRRPGIEFDVDAVLEAAADNDTAIEINGALDRLDASDAVLRRARHLPVLFTISTDSHHPDEFRRLESGVRHARRGWVERDRVVNTWPVERFLEWAGRTRR